MLTAFIKFVIGCYAGAAIEGYQGITEGKYGRGRPIYGLGYVLSSSSFVRNTLTVFVLEFFGSLLFDPEKRLWDYSAKSFNLDGRVCAENLLVFAALMTAASQIKPFIMAPTTVVLLGGLHANSQKIAAN